MGDRRYGGKGDDVLKGDDEHQTFVARGGDDMVFGRGGDDRIYGEGGNDTLIGGDGNDTLIAGRHDYTDPGGRDSLDGGLGDDTLAGGASDTLIGGSGDDVVNAFGPGGVLEGGAGHDRMFLQLDQAYSGDLSELVDQRNGQSNLDGTTISGFEGGGVQLVGGSNNVVHMAAKLNDWFVNGGDGADLITGNSHDNDLIGEAGDDTLVGLGGDDRLGGDYLSSAKDHDVLQGGAGADTLTGGQGSASLDGGTGDDVIYGSVGLDTTKGGGGDDVLHASNGADLLEGGKGQDQYIFTHTAQSSADAPDLIRDADFGVVDLSGIDADSRTRFDNEAFHLVDHLSGRHAELTIAYSAADHMTHVEGDVDGDGQADLVILIAGKHTDIADYVL